MSRENSKRKKRTRNNNTEERSSKLKISHKEIDDLYNEIYKINNILKDFLLKDKYEINISDIDYIYLNSLMKENDFYKYYTLSIFKFIYENGNKNFNFKDEFSSNVERIPFFYIDKYSEDVITNQIREKLILLSDYEKKSLISLEEEYKLIVKNKDNQDLFEKSIKNIFELTNKLYPLSYRLSYLKNYIEKYKLIREKLFFEEQKFFEEQEQNSLSNDRMEEDNSKIEEESDEMLKKLAKDLDEIKNYIIYSNNIIKQNYYRNLVDYGRVKLDDDIFKKIKNEIWILIVQIVNNPEDKKKRLYQQSRSSQSSFGQLHSLPIIIEGGVLIENGVDEDNASEEKKNLDYNSYVILRASDTIHDFYKSRGSLIDENKVYVKNINFTIGKERKKVIDVYNKINEKYKTTPFFTYLDNDEPGNFDEPKVITDMNNYILNEIGNDDEAKKGFYSRYRMNESYIKEKLKGHLNQNEAQYFSNLEPTAEGKIQKSDTLNPNLKYCIIRYNNTIKDDERKNIFDKVKQFIGEKNEICVDMMNSTKDFFKLLEIEAEKQKIPIFTRRDSSLINAEMWDSAGSFKKISQETYGNLFTFKPTAPVMTLDTPLLKESIGICDNFSIKLERNNAEFFKNKYPYGNKAELSNKNPKCDNDDCIFKYDNKGIASRSVGNLSAMIPKYADSEKIQKANDDDVCLPFYIKNSGDWGQVMNAKVNKTYLITDDSLCSYYSILTKTSTITTFTIDGDKYTIIYKNGLESKLQEYIDQITKLLDTNFFKKYYKSLIIKTKTPDNQEITLTYEPLKTEIKAVGIDLNKEYENYKDTEISIILTDSKVSAPINADKLKKPQENFYNLVLDEYIKLNDVIIDELLKKPDIIKIDELIASLNKKCEEKNKITFEDEEKKNLELQLKEYIKLNYEKDLNNDSSFNLNDDKVIFSYLEKLLLKLIEEDPKYVFYLYYKLDTDKIKIDISDLEKYKTQFNYDNIKEENLKPEPSDFDFIYDSKSKDELIKILSVDNDGKIGGIAKTKFHEEYRNPLEKVIKCHEKDEYKIIEKLKIENSTTTPDKLRGILKDFLNVVDNESLKGAADLAADLEKIKNGINNLDKITITCPHNPKKKSKQVKITQLSKILDFFITNIGRIREVKLLQEKKDTINKFNKSGNENKTLNEDKIFKPRNNNTLSDEVIESLILSEGLWDIVYYNPEFLSLWLRKLIIIKEKDKLKDNKYYSIYDDMLSGYNLVKKEDKAIRDEKVKLHQSIEEQLMKLLLSDDNPNPNSLKNFEELSLSLGSKDTNGLKIIYTNTYNIFNPKNTDLITNIKDNKFTFEQTLGDKLHKYKVEQKIIKDWDSFKSVLDILYLHCTSVLENRIHLSKFYRIQDYIIPFTRYLYELVSDFKLNVEFIEELVSKTSITDKKKQIENLFILGFNKKYRELIGKFKPILDKKNTILKEHIEKLETLFTLNESKIKLDDTIDLMNDKQLLKIACDYYNNCIYNSGSAPMVIGGYYSYKKEILTDLAKYNITKLNENKIKSYCSLLEKRDKLVSIINNIEYKLENEINRKHSFTLVKIRDNLKNYRTKLIIKDSIYNYYANLDINMRDTKEYLKKLIKK